MQSSPRALGCLVLLLGLTLFASAASGTSPARTKAGCPTSLAPDATAAAGVAAAAARDVPGLYPQSQYRRFRITALSSLAPGTFTPPRRLRLPRHRGAPLRGTDRRPLVGGLPHLPGARDERVPLARCRLRGADTARLDPLVPLPLI